MAAHCLSTLQVENMKLNDWVITSIKEKMGLFYPLLGELWNTHSASVVDARRFMSLLTWVAKLVGKGKISHKDYWTHRSLFWKGGCWAADCWRLGNHHYMLDLPLDSSLGLFSWPLLLAIDRVWPPDLLFDSWQLFLNHHTETGSAVIPVTVTSVKVLSRNTLIMNLQCSQSNTILMHSRSAHWEWHPWNYWNRFMGNPKTIICLLRTLRI